jgi:hypothetical protein
MYHRRAGVLELPEFYTPGQSQKKGLRVNLPAYVEFCDVPFDGSVPGNNVRKFMNTGHCEHEQRAVDGLWSLVVV